MHLQIKECVFDREHVKGKLKFLGDRGDISFFVI